MFLILCLPFFPLMYLRRKKERSKEEGQEGGRGENKTNKKKLSTNTAAPGLHRVNVFYLLGQSRYLFLSSSVSLQWDIV